MSRNPVHFVVPARAALVTSREGRVSRNPSRPVIQNRIFVTSREGRVSRNIGDEPWFVGKDGHVPRGTCE